jgi:hypothetical protein
VPAAPDQTVLEPYKQRGKIETATAQNSHGQKMKPGEFGMNPPLQGLPNLSIRSEHWTLIILQHVRLNYQYQTPQILYQRRTKQTVKRMTAERKENNFYNNNLLQSICSRHGPPVPVNEFSFPTCISGGETPNALILIVRSPEPTVLHFTERTGRELPPHVQS